MLSNTIHQFDQQFIMDTVMECFDDVRKLSFHWKFTKKWLVVAISLLAISTAAKVCLLIIIINVFALWKIAPKYYCQEF